MEVVAPSRLLNRTWKSFQPDAEGQPKQLARRHGINMKLNPGWSSRITFNVPGLYDLSISASDYDQVASCGGCVAITDVFRPRFGGTCPTYVDNVPALTIDSLADIRSTEAAFDEIVKPSNVLNNANSGGYCNEAISRIEYVRDDLMDFTGTCYDDAALATSLSNLKTTPFIDDLQTDYSYLGASCEAASDGNTCTLHKCLMVRPNYLATKTISIKSTIQAASTNVLNALPSKPEGSDASSHVYYSIPCTEFKDADPACHYIAKLSDLLEVTNKFVTTFPLCHPRPTKLMTMCFVRYNLNDGSWAIWNPNSDSPIPFTQSSTTINIEAWTGCGMVGDTFSFNVNLYVHSTLTCSKFAFMWKLVGSESNSGGTYCTYPGSDFAVMNMKMASSDVIPHDDGTVTGTYTGAKCEIMVKEDGESVPQTTYSTLWDVNSAPIDMDFAVELVHDPHTAQKSAATVACTFTRTARVSSMMRADDTDPRSLTCSYDFTFTDCEKPELYQGNEELCTEECAGELSPGPNEACGGIIVTSSSSTTSVSTTPKTCCMKCLADISCIPLGSSTIHRCETERLIIIPSNGEGDGWILLAKFAAVKDRITASATTPALLSATALAVGVILIIIKRRAATVTEVYEDQDAYYPLMG
ncbi:unnamed protein product [Phytophthora lilii]|uniref:Unnamed protein product n=1 Tax=Phytophthora lilii TaxID=2077276 RepID=A0A9W6TWC6_9STRA|nr:unnamed protein product [Phytophthora lilii]